jgi:hypothetical protein
MSTAKLQELEDTVASLLAIARALPVARIATTPFERSRDFAHRSPLFAISIHG